MNERNRAEGRNVLLSLGLIALALSVFLFIITSYFSGIQEIMNSGSIPEDFTDVLVVMIMPMALCILYLFQSGIEKIGEVKKEAKWRLILASISLVLAIVLVVVGIHLAPVMPIIAGNCFTILVVVEMVCIALAGVICLK